MLLGLGGCQNLMFPPTFTETTAPPPPQPETVHFKQEGDSPVIGHIYRVRLQEGDTLADVARHYGIGLQAIQDANPGIDPWAPPPGKEILLPLAFILPDAPHEGIVINLPAMRLFHFPQKVNVEVDSYPVGMGGASWGTPLGRTRIVQKKANPNWVVPVSIRREHAKKGDPLPTVVPPGPDNPLGSHALRLGFPSYLIHGTSKPYGVGLRISHGCIRLYPENIAALYPQVEVGTPVTIVDQPYLIGWRGKQLYLEVHSPLQQKRSELKKILQGLEKHLRQIERETGEEINWKRVTETIAEARGFPVPILAGALDIQTLLGRAPLVPHPGTWPQRYLPPPPFSTGWYVAIDIPLTAENAQKLVAILRHQGPPLPAHRIDNQVVIGPYQTKATAKKIKSRLQRELQLDSRLISPDKGPPLRVADHS